MKTRVKLIDCRTCSGSGEGKFSRICPFCKGTGQLDPSKCFRCGKKSSATITTKQFGIEYVCEGCRLTINEAQIADAILTTRKARKSK